MLLDNVAMIMGNTMRSKAYIQAMVKAKMLPNYCLIYGSSTKDIQSTRDDKNGASYFDINESLLKTLNSNAIPYDIIEEKDINSEEMSNMISQFTEEYIVFSGYGGQILKKKLFELNKKFIHVHAGRLPGYRGSTTVYYSYLKDRKFGATAIFMSEEIDAGDIITFEEFGIPSHKIDIDYIYDPWMRSQVLIRALRMIDDNKLIEKHQKDMIEESETYYIIHPLLKHIALLGIEKELNENSNIYTES